jgi:hypothetical protein
MDKLEEYIKGVFIEVNPAINLDGSNPEPMLVGLNTVSSVHIGEFVYNQPKKAEGIVSPIKDAGVKRRLVYLSLFTGQSFPVEDSYEVIKNKIGAAIAARVQMLASIAHVKS